jgi:cation diffusion facilitator CzcD-associated flavoprotein CzcO
MKKVTRKYELYSHLQLNTQVKSLVWIEEDSKWNVTLFNKQTGKTEEKFFDIVYEN